jgi:hypothetical protein
VTRFPTAVNGGHVGTVGIDVADVANRQETLMFD